MRPENAPEHGSRSSSTKSKNSSSADTPNRKGLGRHFGALLVGFYEGKRLKFAGRVGTGFSEKLLHSLFLSWKKFGLKTCPFFNVPAAGRSRWDQGLTRRRNETLPLG